MDAAGRARWVEIDLKAIAHNVEQVRMLLGPGVGLLAVVKADAYGHGLVEVSRVALARGASMLGVTHPEEGVALRESGITAPILVFRPLLPGEEGIAIAYGLTPSVSSLEQARRLSAAAERASRPVAVHLKLETGMGRTGFLPEALKREAAELFSLPCLRWEGIYTHFAAAATDPGFTRSQFRIFLDVVRYLEEGGVFFALRHVCNSAAALLYPEMRLDLVRVGTLLYGQFPAGIRGEPLDLRDAWSFWARVIHLQRLRRGESVGYGRTYRAKRDTTIAVLPVGYSEGFGVDVSPRPSGMLDLLKVMAKTAGAYFGMPWGTQYVSVNGTAAPVVGRVGMELTCVDVGKIPDIEVGVPVRLQARRTLIRSSVPRLFTGVQEGEQKGEKFSKADKELGEAWRNR